MKLQNLLETNMIGLAMILLITWGSRTSSALPTDLTAEAAALIKRYSELHPNAESALAIVDIPIPSRRTRRSTARSILEVDVRHLVTDAVIKRVKFRATEGILANQDTPVYDATGLDDGLLNTQYSRNHEAMKLLGEFTFYQDYESRAAIVHTHRDNTITGLIGTHGIWQELRTNGTRNTHFRRYLLVEDSAYNIPSFISQDGNLTLRYDTPRPGPLPDVVYPQFLISVDYHYVRGDIVDALTRILSLMNLVDMMYSAVSQPKIKLNIAGIIIPTNPAGAPWISRCAPGDYGMCNYDISSAVEEHLEYYSNSVFTDSWDAALAIISRPLGDRDRPEKRYLGLTSSLSCIKKWGNYKVSLLSAEGYIHYATVAHEIAHFFEVRHDISPDCSEKAIMSRSPSYNPQALMWSPCSLRAMKSYFGKAKSMCLDNLPNTLRIPHNLVPIEPNSVCERLGAGSYDGVVECNGLIKCTSSSDTKIGPPDGTVCSNIGDSKRVCYNGQCLPYTVNSRYEEPTILPN